MNRYLLLPGFLLLLPYPASAGCAPGYAHEQRASIRQHYQQQIMEVNRRRDERIRDALDRYQREYYSQSTALLEEWKKERAALSERIRADESARGNQAAYSDEARSIGKEYRQESRVLRKDHSGKYWKEIADAREEARDLRQAVQELKAEDIAQLNLEIGKDCKKSAKARLRNVFEWVADRVGKNKPEDRSEPPYGATGRRG